MKAIIRVIKAIINWFRLKKVRKIDIICAFVLLVCYILYFSSLSNIPVDFSDNVNIESGYRITTDKNNNIYVIDSSKERILKIVDNKVDTELSSGESSGFYQAERIEPIEDGGFYLHSVEWDNSGFLLANEKIMKYNSSNQNIDTIYEIEYTSDQNVDKHQLFDLQIVDGGVDFIKADNVGFELCHISADKEYSVKKSYNFEKAVTLIQDFALDENSGVIYLADKRGTILYTEENEVKPYCTFNDNMVTPFSIDVGSDGSVYFSDIHKVSINKIYPDKRIEEIINKEILYNGEAISGNDGLLFNLSVDKVKLSDGSTKDVISTIYNGDTLYSVTNDGQILINNQEFKQGFNYLLFEIAICIIFGLCVICAVYLFLRIMAVLIFNKLELKLIYKMEIIVILTAIASSFVIIPMLLPSIGSTYMQELGDKLSSVSTIASNNFDPNLIEHIDNSASFMNDDYKKIISYMQSIVKENMSDSEIMGGQLEKYQDGVGYAIAFPDTSIGVYYPLDPGSVESIKTIYETKQPKTDYMDNAVGTFICARTPIFNKNGDIIAVINIGKDSFIINKFVQDMLINVIINLILILITAIFLVNELFAFLSQKDVYRNKIKATNNKSVTPFHMLRLASFMFSLTLNVSLSFLPVYTLRFYSDDLGIPVALAGALPLVINLFFITISAIICPLLLRKVGFKILTIFSSMCLLVGDILMVTSQTYHFIILALLLNGLGFGLLDNSINIYLTGSDDAIENDAFSMCTAGSSAGLTSGLVFGAFLAEIIPYNQVFILSVIFDVIIVGLCIYLGKILVVKQTENNKNENKVNIFEFLFSKRALPFIIFITIIYNIISGFVSYYLPIYGDKYGYTSLQISLLMILYYLSGIFLNVPLTKAIKNIFKNKAIYLGTIISLIALIIIVNFNNLYILIIGLLILGIVKSFGSGVCNFYFLNGDKVKQYGKDKALGIYAFLSGLGSASSSMVFGTMITTGLVTGMGVFAGIAGIAMVIYRLLFDRKLQN